MVEVATNEETMTPEQRAYDLCNCVECPHCQGRGYFTVRDWNSRQTATYECKTCGGTGKMNVKKRKP